MTSFASIAASIAPRLAPRLALATTAAAICLAAAAGPATAASAAPFESDMPRMVEVAIGDLNLANPEHQKRLDTRLRAAAREVCANGGITVADRTEQSQCIRQALDAAAPQRMAAIASPVG